MRVSTSYIPFELEVLFDLLYVILIEFPPSLYFVITVNWIS